MEIRIRKYSKNDAQSLLALYHDTVHAVNSKDYTAEQLDAWIPSAVESVDTWKERFAKEKALIAEIDGHITGFATLGYSGKGLGMLYVSKDFQGKGVGSMLLKKIEKKLTKKNVEVASAEVSITARPFFEKRGYVWVKDNRKMINGHEFLNFIMEKKLSGESKTKMKKEKDVKTVTHWPDILKQKFLDLIIVILGVTIAFQLNNIKNESDARILEQFYYGSLLTDVNRDIENINVILESLKKEKITAIKYLKVLNDPAASKDSLGLEITGLMQLESFSGNDNTYRTLVGSSGLNALKDPNVRRQITEYYRLYAFVQRFENIQTKLLFEFFDYLSPHLDYYKQEITDQTLYEDVRMRNFLTIFVSHLTTGVEDYEEALGRAAALKKVIETEILKN